MKNGVIFDLDGTLLDTIEDIATACNRGIAEFGFAPRTVAEYKRLVGSGIEALVRLVLPADFVNESLFPQVLTAVRREYAVVAAGKTRPYDGIPELLDELARRGVPMAVLSNKPHEFTVENVKRLLGKYPFRAVYGARAGRPHKPDPAVPLEIANLMGVAPEHVLLAGDTEVDIATADHAGMKAVACTWGFRPREELIALKPFAVIDAPGELLSFL